MNRENTPFAAKSNALSARFGPIKDKFVEKYEPLLKESERRTHIDELAKRSREYLIGQRQFQIKKKKAQTPPVYINGASQSIPMKNDGNIWGQMQKMVMRDGRVYNLDGVLQKIKDMKISVNDQQPIVNRDCYLQEVIKEEDNQLGLMEQLDDKDYFNNNQQLSDIAKNSTAGNNGRLVSY